MTPEQFLQKCESAFAADEPQVIPASVARAMCEAMRLACNVMAVYPATQFGPAVLAFTAACKEIEA